MDFEAYVDAQAALLGLPIASEHRPGVLRYLQLVAGLSPRVMDFALAPADESGSVFVPVSPPGLPLVSPPGLLPVSPPVSPPVLPPVLPPILSPQAPA
ncbi:MAG: DUF4089 domain-containing protein [Rubrivivax sp.]|nr:DUF4089 domain-containing protein [Rubrivivax sp.]